MEPQAISREQKIPAASNTCLAARIRISADIEFFDSTVSSHEMPLESHMALLRPNGTLIQVGAPEDSLPSFNAFSLIGKNCKIGGSTIGAPWEIREMLDLTVQKGVKPWIETRPMKDANKAIVDMTANKARYRYVLVN